MRTRIACLLVLVVWPAAVSAQRTDATPPAAGSAAGQGGVPAVPSSWAERLELFVGLDGSKQPQDLGINANMGVRASANLGMPIVEASGLGAQVGIGLNLSDAAVHVLDQIEGTSRRTQVYVTVAFFQRHPSGLEWSLGYDLLHQRYYDDVTLGQLRGHAGTAVGDRNGVGVWLATHVASDDASMAGRSVVLKPITQASGYVQHTWPAGARTTAWLGVAGGHHEVVWVFPANPRTGTVPVYGASLDVPLSPRVSLTGAANFVTPTATGTVDAYLGLTWSPRTGTGRPRFAPAMPVANSPWFPVDLRR